MDEHTTFLELEGDYTLAKALERMYLRWAASVGLDAYSPYLNSNVLVINGEHPKSLLLSENGLHIYYDHGITMITMVRVYTDHGDDLDPNDLTITTRYSGDIPKPPTYKCTDTAMYHKPTGIGIRVNHKRSRQYNERVCRQFIAAKLNYKSKTVEPVRKYSTEDGVVADFLGAHNDIDKTLDGDIMPFLRSFHQSHSPPYILI